MPFAVILQLVKAKAQNGQMPAVNFVKVENTSNQQTQPNFVQEKVNKDVEIDSEIKKKITEIPQNQQKSLSNQETLNLMEENKDDKIGKLLDQKVVVDRTVKEQEQKPQELQKEIAELPTAKKEFVKMDESENENRNFVEKNPSQDTEAEFRKLSASIIDTAQSQQKIVSKTVTDRSAQVVQQTKASASSQLEKNGSTAFQKIEQEKIADQNNKTEVISKDVLNEATAMNQEIAQNSSDTQNVSVKEMRVVQEKASQNIPINVAQAKITQNAPMNVLQEKKPLNASVDAEAMSVQYSVLTKEDVRKTESVNDVKNAAQLFRTSENSTQRIVQENSLKAAPQINNVGASEKTDIPKVVNTEQYQGEVKKLDFRKPLNTTSDKETPTQNAVKNAVNEQKTIDIPSQGQQRLVLSREIVEYLISQPQSASQVIQTVKEKVSSASKQSGILAQNIVSEKSSYGKTTEQIQQIGLSFKQAQVVVKNAILQIQDSTNEFSQFRQIKREIPDQLKTSQPIKIENFKLEIARDLKKETPQIFEQPRNEKFEQTEHLRELLNNRSARKTYEAEHQQTVQTQQEFRKDIDSIVLRVEQQERSSNLQMIVDTIRQMHNTMTEKAVVDLSPPNLGKLEIELVKQQEKLVITFKVVTDEAKEMLEKSSKDLISRLNTLGFKVEQVEVKTLPKTEEDYLNRGQQEQEQHHEKRHKRQQEEVKEDDQRD